MNYTERRLGAAAFGYIRQRLAEGHTFAHELDRELDIVQGTVFAYLPDTVSDEHAVAFGRGGVLPTPPESTWRRDHDSVRIPIPSTNDWLSQRVHDYIARTPDGLAVFEDWITRPSDPFWAKVPEHRQAVSFVGDEVYYIVRHDDIDRVPIAIQGADSVWPGLLCALTGVGGEVSNYEEAWSALAKAAVEVVVGAYDGESFLVWRETSR